MNPLLDFAERERATLRALLRDGNSVQDLLHECSEDYIAEVRARLDRVNTEFLLELLDNTPARTTWTKPSLDRHIASVSSGIRQLASGAGATEANGEVQLLGRGDATGMRNTTRDRAIAMGLRVLAFFDAPWAWIVVGFVMAWFLPSLWQCLGGTQECRLLPFR